MPTARATTDEALVTGARLTHPDRVLYPEPGITKRQLAAWYERAAERMLPHLADRPLNLIRCPRGQAGKCFVQRHLTETPPAGVRELKLDGEQPAITVRDVSGLVGLVQLGALEIHPWGSRADRLDRPDRLIFDLDPGPELGWPDVVAAARLVRDRLADLGLESYIKTTGGKGLHVVLPIARRTPWGEALSFARGLADAIERDQPERYVAENRKAKREGKLFIDYLRNAREASSVAPYSSRAKPAAPVSMPLGWDELDAIASADAFTVANAAERLAAPDPWAAFVDSRQGLTERMQRRLR